MDLASRLDLLLEVSIQGSFAQAADARGIDRSVLSKQIRKLEESLGLRLLNRSTRSLSLTPAGEVIVKQAQQVRDVLDKTRLLADTFSDTPKGNLRISSTSLFGRKYLKDCIVAFLKKYPKVSVEIVLNDRKVDLIGERFDLAFRVGNPVDSNLVAKNSRIINYFYLHQKSLCPSTAIQRLRKIWLPYLQLFIPMALTK